SLRAGSAPTATVMDRFSWLLPAPLGHCQRWARTIRTQGPPVGLPLGAVIEGIVASNPAYQNGLLSRLIGRLGSRRDRGSREGETHARRGDDARFGGVS